MHPFLPVDVLVVQSADRNYTCSLDDHSIELEEKDGLRFAELSQKMSGYRGIEEVIESFKDEHLIVKLQAAGVVFDLPIMTEGIPTKNFCDYLYARIKGWRASKHPNHWPWRAIISGGHASTAYLQGIVIENYHYVRAAVVRHGPLLSRAGPQAFEDVRKFVLDEAKHEDFFLDTLTRWNVNSGLVKRSIPLTSTQQFIALGHRLAQLSVLDYFAGSATLEIDPEIFGQIGDPYEAWEKLYAIDPSVLAPIRKHIRDDVLAGHSELFRTMATAEGVILSVGVARSAFQSARTVFEATRLWQRDIFEHYHLLGAGPCMTAF